MDVSQEEMFMCELNFESFIDIFIPVHQQPNETLPWIKLQLVWTLLETLMMFWEHNNNTELVRLFFNILISIEM